MVFVLQTKQETRNGNFVPMADYILTLAMFPVLAGMCVHLAHTEGREARQEFAANYERYTAAVPRWFPRLRGAVDDRRVAG